LNSQRPGRLTSSAADLARSGSVGSQNHARALNHSARSCDFAACWHFAIHQATGPIAGVIDSSLKSRRVAFADHVFARYKIKIASIEWNRSVDAALPSALIGERRCLEKGIVPLPWARVAV
jgi:hypothetical protein